MIIDAYTFCWNEEMRLKYYLNLYAPLCRKITIYDNGSTDSSKEIASKYDNIIWETETYNQSEIDDARLTFVKNNCWKQSQDADWVIVCDVDEILYHTDGLDNYLSKTLTETEKRIIQAYGYDMVSSTLPSHEGNFYDDDDFKFGVPNTMYDKTCIFSPSLVEEINYDPGSHVCDPKPKGPRWRRNKQVMPLHDPNLKLLHYKYLNKESFVNKQKQFGKKLCEKNIEQKFGIEYLDPQKKMENQFDEKLKDRKRVVF